MGWIGAGYVASNPLAAAVTLLIGACYVAGAWELLRYRQATATLSHAVAGLTEPPAKLDPWLDTLHPGLRGAVRARVEGARVALPGPALTPYLVGLLVLLGMLGTLLGMVVTLKGTGAALESATDLDAIRASLIAPVKGLGFAFGTSIAGVATSAMLGLLSALVRRERIDAAQQLDAKIATTLRVHSSAHQRDESFRLLQRQADVMPALVDRLQTMMTTLEARSVALHDRQLESQQAFFDRTERAYAGLASNVGDALKESAAESARVAGAALQPVVAATMTGLAQEMAALRDTVTGAVQRQLDGLTDGFEKTTGNVTAVWNRALDEQRRAGDAVAQQLQTTLGQFTDTFAQRSSDLLDGVATRLESTEGRLSDAWRDALARQEQVGETLAGQHARALGEAAATFERHSAATLAAVRESHAGLQTQLAARDEARLSAWNDSLAAMAAKLGDEWQRAGEHSAGRQQEICDALTQTTRDLAAQASTFEQRSNDLLTTIRESHTGLQSQLAARDEERLSAWNDSLAAMAAKLGDEWQRAGVHSAGRQQEICDALAQTTRDLAAQASTFEQRSNDLLTTIRESHTGLQSQLAARDEERLSAWSDSLAAMAAKLGDEWQRAGVHSAGRQQEICDALAQTTRDLAAQASTFEQRSNDLLTTIRESHTDLQSQLAARDEARLSAWNDSLAAMAAKLGDEWQRAGVHSAGRQQEICDALAQTTRDLAAQASTFEQRSNDLLTTIRESHTGLQSQLAARDEARLAAWNDSLAAMAAALRDEWAQTSAQAAARQQDICDTLTRTANDITAQAQVHASDTINEIARLVQAASEAPKAAADVVAELRQRLSDSMVRDTAMLEERSRLLATLETLLGAVNHASTEQRAAIDALVSTSADLLDRVGARFNDTVEAETRKLDSVAAQVTAGAVEVASLGDAFGMAVQVFGESNDKLLTHLQRIEAALEKSLARSDEQLEYYVAQAREVIDLSVMSQKQIVEDLQQLAGRRAPVGA
ncbi:Methyl-accepting chemotaxis protein [Burkholderia cenocepacia H111]|nr:Methyl-accepting chemotaxis protein [Burkholderia cenocepacia H111]